ncbi:MAG: ATP-binding protein [Alphaproteobacteria bacterium]
MTKRKSLEFYKNQEDSKSKDTHEDLNKLKTIVEAIKEPTILINENDVILIFNQSAEKIFFSSIATDSFLNSEDKIPIGLRIQSIIRSTLLLETLNLYKDNQKDNIEKIEITLPGEIDRSYEVDISRVPNFSKDEFNYLLIFRETTEVKKILTLRSEFIANASHELKTPISIIKGIAETLEKYGDEDKETFKDFLKKLIDESNRAQLLIEDLLSLNQAEMRQHILPEKEVNLMKVLDNIFDGLNELAKKNKIKLSKELEKKEYLIQGDENDIRIAFVNLIENALKYNNTGQSVNIKIFENDLKIIFEVKDDGPGIHEDHISRLTERFYRVNSDIRSSGTGLGLSIVKNIVSRHKAQLEIESKLGIGSSFSIIFNKI